MNASDAARSAADILVTSPRFLTAPLYRHWHLRWGATDAEVASSMPGDELVPEMSFNAARAITIAAPPEDVWPWIVQLGTGQAGFYSYDLFDNHGRPSADRILPQFQHPKVGFASRLQVPIEEGNDASAGVLGGGLVETGARDHVQHHQQGRLIGGGMVVEEPVAGIGIDLDVVVHPDHGEGLLQPGGGAVAHRGAVLAAVAADDRAGAG
jgi:hypothetical protein